MINDILSRHPEGGFERVLELIIASELSVEKKYTDYFEVKIEAELYIEQLCGSIFYNVDTGEERWSDGLREIFSDLRNLGVIESYIMRPYTKADRAEYDTAELMADLYFDQETGSPIASAPWDQGALYLENGGPYYIKCNKEKVTLFSDIIYKRRKYLCKVGMIKFLHPYFKNIDMEAFLDFMELDTTYIFNDNEILLYSIASSTRQNLAKMYYYFSRFRDGNDEEYFRWELTLEKEVIMDNTEFNYPNKYKDFYFNSSLDKKTVGNTVSKIEYISNGSVNYDPIAKQMQIGGKYIHFKGAKLQIALIEYLIENQNRSISGVEAKSIGIKDLKFSIDDIKRKIKDAGVSQRQCKDLFHYFVDEGEKYCRILL